ncbi:MBL fold metallo-hydrolase [Formosa sp. 4Alg 33]|uniref:MBL fold metallo-hydrolase n=1 Tax=Formosa sp. 4Alg 33 TaxID=3382189 RepID=UPI003D9C02DB
MGIIIGIGILILVIGIILFLYVSPQFGDSPTAIQEQKFALTNHYKDGKFINIGEVDMQMGIQDIGKSLIGYFRPTKGVTPESPISVETILPSDLMDYSGETRLFWFGHSTFLLQIQSKNILIDPMFGDVPAPHPMLGSKRFSNHLPIRIDDLPPIDAVLISHDHYDHLDYKSISKLKHKVKSFYTPLGVGAHLKSWGVSKDNIYELDWWEEIMFTDLKFVCTPAQHFSGRGISDKGKTLWSSWIITSKNENIFFSGDSGYGSHFKTIGEKYGPFDFAMIECGQYNTLWHEIHMYPEETAQAAIDVKAKQMMPIHWGAFKLAMHEWNEPVERLLKASEIQNINVIVPKIGEEIKIGKTITSTEAWWE